MNKQDDNEKIQHQSQNHEFVHDKVLFYILRWCDKLIKHLENITLKAYYRAIVGWKLISKLW